MVLLAERAVVSCCAEGMRTREEFVDQRAHSFRTRDDCGRVNVVVLPARVEDGNCDRALMNHVQIHHQFIRTERQFEASFETSA